MKIFPAIDLYGGKAVRLYKGDYAQMTVYNDDPVAVAKDFQRQGATCIHVVDLAGAKEGVPVHFEVVENIAKNTGLFDCLRILAISTSTGVAPSIPSTMKIILSASSQAILA